MKMKKILILACVISLSAAAWAGNSIDYLNYEATKKDSVSEDFLSTIKAKEFELGLEIYSHKYEEPGLMEQSGTFAGFVASYTKRGWVDTKSFVKGMGRLESQLAWGIVDYDGSLQDGTPFTQEGINDFTCDVRALLGADLLTDNSLSTFYVGLGYRYLFDGGGAHRHGYDRKSNYIYVPVGIESLMGLKNGWSWGWGAEYDFFITGRQESDLTAYGEGVISNDQSSGSGFRASIKFQKKFDNKDFVIEPFVRIWDIDDSAVSNGYYEPKNKTTEIGIRFTLLF
jgi:hypothetical protein